MIAQRMKHYEFAPITDENGQIVPHTPELITQIFDEELARILDELSPAELVESRATYSAARRISEDMITLGQFDPV
jgi:hypothetical protein